MLDYYNTKDGNKIAKRIFLEDLRDCRKFPKYFQIETVTGCNASCFMCIRAVDKKKIEYMNDALFEEIIAELEPYNNWVEMVTLHRNNEPLLDKEISKKVKMLKSIGIKRVQISSNGALLDTDLAYRLYEAGLDDIRFSVDGYSKDVYEKIRCGLKREQVYKNIENFLDIRDKLKWDIEVRLRMVVMKENESEREEWKKYWTERLTSRDKVQFIDVQPWKEFGFEQRKQNIEKMASIPCLSVFSSMNIGYNGAVYLCCLDEEDNNILGNLGSNSIEEIWRGEKIENIRRMHLEKKRNNIPICKGCVTWYEEYS